MKTIEIEKRKEKKWASTKAVACRVPMDDYIRLLKEASEKRMTMAELIIYKLYANEPAGKELVEALENGRHYLMGIEPDKITPEDALEAFGFGRNGLKTD